MHLHCEMDPTNAYFAAQNNLSKSFSAMQLTVAATGLSDGAHTHRSVSLHAHKWAVCACKTLLCKRVFVTVQCRGSAYAMGEGC